MKTKQEDNYCTKKESHLVSSSGTGGFISPLTKNAEQRTHSSEICLGPVVELGTLSVLQSFKHFPHHMAVPALTRDFPPPVPHVPKVGTCKIELASTAVLISPFFYEHRSCGVAACSLCVPSCYLRVGKKHHEVLFPSHDSLLKICCDKIILDELLIQSLQNTLWSGEGVHAKNSAPAKRNGTMCSWQRHRVGRNQNPFTSAQPQLPLPPPNQIKITFPWGL